MNHSHRARLLANGVPIGSTTYSEYRGIFEKDHALARRFLPRKSTCRSRASREPLQSSKACARVSRNITACKI